MSKENHSCSIPRLYLLLLLSAVPHTAAQTNNGLAIPPSPNGLQNFNPSMTIVIVVLITAFFFMGFFSIYISQCIGEVRTDRGVRPMNGSVGRSRKGRGLDPAYIESFPTFVYSDVKGLKIGKGALECAVCISEFEDEETLRLIPKCDHVFHPECIDVWLVSHTTCPVCRANLLLESDPVTGGAADTQVSDSETGLDDENRSSSEIEEEQNEVSIRVVDDQNRVSEPEVINVAQIPNQNRPARSKSMMRPRIAGKFPRSHSTGHSLVQPGENCERFTLRLPEDVRKQIMSGKLNRTTSCLAFPAGDGSVSGGSTRRGYRTSGGEGSSRGRNYQFWRFDQEAKSDRWMFSRAPPFFTRTSSVASSKRADGDGSLTPKAFLTSVKTPFDCLGSKIDGNGQTSDRCTV